MSVVDDFVAVDTNGMEEMRMKHVHKKAKIEQILEVSVIDTMSEPGTKPVMLTPQEIRLQKTRHIDKNIARMLKLPTSLPYIEITKVDEQNKTILMETHVQIKKYELHVATLYQELIPGQVNVECRLLCRGVQKNSIMHMGLKAYVERQFNEGRQAEEVALLGK